MIIEVSLGFITDWTFITRIFSSSTSMHCGRVSSEGGLPSKILSANVTRIFSQLQMGNFNVNFQLSPIHIRFWAGRAEELLKNLLVDNRIVSLQLLIGWAQVIANIALKYILNHSFGVISHFVAFQMTVCGKLLIANLAGRFPLQVLLYVASKSRLPRHYFLACVTREPFTFCFCSGLG